MSLRRVYSYKFKIANEKIDWPEYLDRLYEKITTDHYMYAELDSILIHEPKDNGTSVVEIHVHPKYETARYRRIPRERIEMHLKDLDEEIKVQEELDAVLRKARRLRSDTVLEGLQKEFGPQA